MSYSIKTSFDADIKVIGNLIYKGKLVDESYLQIILGSNGLDRLLKESAGFFSFYCQDDDYVYLAVDRVRAKPLFYSIQNDCIHVSDRFESLQERIGEIIVSELTQSEFLLTGYVCGADTLQSNIKQVEAGQLVKISKLNGVVIKSDYFLFEHIEPESFSESRLESELRSAILKVFSRLIDFANGRQIVLPLSGGFDSRLVASTLKELKYENVVCFSYGKDKNKEALFSKIIADALGYDWHFVNYANDKWKSAWFSEESSSFQKAASQGTSLPHVQDWLAIKELKSKGVVTEDAIFVPGHSGDFVAGSHIPSSVFRNQKLTQEGLIEQIKRDHFACMPITPSNAFYSNSRLDERISKGLPLRFDGSNVSYANVYECWDWRERQAKYIVNSVRAYEFFEFNWWLPLWDKEFIGFWCKVPLSMRKERLWYNKVVSKIFIEQAGDSVRLSSKNAAEKSALRKLAHITYPLLPTILKKAIYKKKIRGDFNSHFLNLGALLSEAQKDDFARYNYTIVGVYNELFILNKWGK